MSHYAAGTRFDLKLLERIARKTVEHSTGCWEFRGAQQSGGYGVVGYRTGGRTKTEYVHRVAYRALRGEIPPGLQLDHLCRNRQCWNPEHLDPVPHRVNGLRGMAPTVVAHRAGRCLRGHAQTAENVYAYGGKRQCAVCARETARRRTAERRRAAA